MSEAKTFWKRCSSCKKELGFNVAHYVCSVSTCRGKRTGFVFCSVPCWDAHLGGANHRSAFAEDAVSPSKEEFQRSLSNADSEAAPRRTVPSASAPKLSVPVQSSGGAGTGAFGASPAPIVETLVVVSKVKKLIRDLAEFNTSECAIDALTDQVVSACTKAVESARAAGRKTVMGRDFK